MSVNLKDLMEAFPEYADEMTELSRYSTCPCSGCMWNIMKMRHEELNDDMLPEKFRGIVAWS